MIDKKIINKPMKLYKIAVRYAKALFDLAQEQNILDLVKNDVDLVIDTFSKSRELTTIMQNPVIKNDKKQAIIRQIFGEKVHKITTEFLCITIAKGRCPILLQILQEFIEMYKDFNNIITAYVKSPIKLDAESKAKIMEIISRSTKRKVELHEEIDESLIGGFIIRFAHKQYDASIRKQLLDLSKQFKQNIQFSNI